MKKILGSIILTIAFILVIGFVGGYEANNITFIQLLIYEAFTFAFGYLGYKMLGIEED